MRNRNSPARCCCGGGGIRFRVRAETCDGDKVPNVSIVVMTEDLEDVVASGMVGASSPYWANLTAEEPGTYRIAATSNLCEGSILQTVEVVDGGDYVVAFECEPPLFRLPASWLGVFDVCFKHHGSFPGFDHGDHLIEEYHDLEYLGRDELGYGWLRLRGDNPYVRLSDLHGKLTPQTVRLDPDPCPPPESDRDVHLGYMATRPGWVCDCFVCDGLGRDKVLVSTMVGSKTIDGHIGQGGASFTATLGPVLLGEEDVEDCGGGEFRAEAQFGTAALEVRFGWNLCDVPTAWMEIPHPNDDYAIAEWYAACPIDYDNRRFRAYRGGPKWRRYEATGHTINSRISPASITFTWDGLPGAYDEYSSIDDVPRGPLGQLGSALPGSLTLTEVM